MTENVICSVLSWDPLLPIPTFSLTLRHSKASRFLKVDRLFRSSVGGSFLVSFLGQDDGMHSVHRTFLGTPWKELLAFDCACHDIADYRVFLGEVSCKIHLFPIETVKIWRVGGKETVG